MTPPPPHTHSSIPTTGLPLHHPVLNPPQPTAHCPLPTAHCPLPTAHCPLPTAHCPLPHRTNCSRPPAHATKPHRPSLTGAAKPASTSHHPSDRPPAHVRPRPESHDTCAKPPRGRKNAPFCTASCLDPPTQGIYSGLYVHSDTPPDTPPLPATMRETIPAPRPPTTPTHGNGLPRAAPAGRGAQADSSSLPRGANQFARISERVKSRQPNHGTNAQKSTHQCQLQESTRRWKPNLRKQKGNGHEQQRD